MVDIFVSNPIDNGLGDTVNTLWKTRSSSTVESREEIAARAMAARGWAKRFVYAGNLSANGVTFSGNQAIGGNGGEVGLRSGGSCVFGDAVGGVSSAAGDSVTVQVTAATAAAVTTAARG